MNDYNVIDSLEQSLNTLWFDVVSFVPELIVALLVIIVGWIIGGVLGSLVTNVLKRFHLDSALDKAGVDELSRRAGYQFKPAAFAGSLVKWFIILAFAIVAFDVLHLDAVTTFMRDVVLGYLPLVFAAVLILFAGIIIANIVQSLAAAMVRSAGGKKPEFFGKAAYYLVLIFTFMAVLSQLQIASDLVQTLFMGIVFALSLGIGLAFGLGGKDVARRYLDDLTKSDTRTNIPR